MGGVGVPTGQFSVTHFGTPKKRKREECTILPRIVAGKGGGGGTWTQGKTRTNGMGVILQRQRRRGGGAWGKEIQSQQQQTRKGSVQGAKEARGMEDKG